MVLLRIALRPSSHRLVVPNEAEFIAKFDWYRVNHTRIAMDLLPLYELSSFKFS